MMFFALWLVRVGLLNLVSFVFFDTYTWTEGFL